MAEKKGAGGEPQEYNESNGRYGSGGDNKEGSELLNAVKNYNPDDLKSEVYKRTAETPKLNRSNPKEFHGNLSRAKESNLPKERWKVDTTHNEDFYEHCKCFTGLGGCTVAVEDSGDNKGNIVSVCKNQETKERGVLSQLLSHAVANGGDRLDAFGEGLFNKYQREGFEPISWTPFNTKFAPDGWKPQYGAIKNPIIFYRYVGKGKTSNVTFQEFIKNNKPFEGDDGYDRAEKYRNEVIRKNGKSVDNI